MQAYIGIEVLSMTPSQRQTLIDAIRALLPEATEQPAWRVHSRMRLDGNAVIIEARWRDADVTDAKIINYLANAFGVAPGTVTSAATSNAFGRVLTFTQGAVARVRFILFGGVGTSWEVSRQATLAYLAANLLQWET